MKKYFGNLYTHKDFPIIIILSETEYIFSSRHSDGYAEKVDVKDAHIIIDKEYQKAIPVKWYSLNQIHIL